VSTDYYVRLEQGRDRNPSAQVLDALAQALQLDEEATAHLHALAGPERRAHRSGQEPERVPPSIRQLIAGWHDTPAYVQGRRLDVLAANPLATALSPLFTPGVNLLRAAFLDPTVRTLFGDHWESLAHNTIAGLRALIGPDVDDPLNELVGELSVRSDHFRTLWARHDIRARISGGRRHMHHPQVGELELHYEHLQVSGTDGQTLIIYHADPGSRTEQALALLATLPADRSPSNPPTGETGTGAQPQSKSQHRPG
jgi:transcriptional regulator with XRE-family HTH domain